MRLRHRLIDLPLAALILVFGPILYLAARWRCNLQTARRIQDLFGITIVRNHYYEPVFVTKDIASAPEAVRLLPGLDMNPEGQLEILSRFQFSEELLSLDGGVVGGHAYHYDNQRSMFAEGDADALYSFIRAFKPRTIVEIGCGQSSIVAQLALRKNRVDGQNYESHHICFEPFQNSWLNSINVDFRAERIERVDLDLFRNLKENDIVFIDSTHVVRAQGDVEHEILRILPVLSPGVIVHIHDIFTPRDYSRQFLLDDRRFWTEQYMLESFLSFNSDFEVLMALHDLHKRREQKLYDAIPILEHMPDRNPGSFWIRRCGAGMAASAMH